MLLQSITAGVWMGTIGKNKWLSQSLITLLYQFLIPFDAFLKYVLTQLQNWMQNF